MEKKYGHNELNILQVSSLATEESNHSEILKFVFIWHKYI